MTDLKAQHQLRARLVREGTRTLAAAAITDYRAAKPTHQPKPQTMTLIGVDGDTTVELEVTDVKVIRSIRDGNVDAYSMARGYEGSTITATVEHPDGEAAALQGLARAAAVREMSDYAAAIRHATTPNPLPSADTRDGLLARLNARHHSTRTAS